LVIALTFDGAGNMYISGTMERVLKVDVSGIIHSIAGVGSIGFSGDGGPATAANFYFPYDITVDDAANIYVCDVMNSRIRKISTSGVITTVAGNGTTTSSGDGGPATAAGIDNCNGLEVDHWVTC
jgi:hypothetical protein